MHPGKTKLPSGKRTVSEPCERCSGQGKIEIEMPKKVPLERLEGGATGFVQREYVLAQTPPSRAGMCRAHMMCTMSSQYLGVRSASAAFSKKGPSHKCLQVSTCEYTAPVEV